MELWDSAPYLHDGSAATLDDVFLSGEHSRMGLNESQRQQLVSYLRTIDQSDFIEDDEVFTPPTEQNQWIVCATEGGICTPQYQHKCVMV